MSAQRVRSQRRRAAILLELLLALVLLVGIGAFIVRAASDALDSVHLQRREQQALDLARSLLASLDAGLLSAQELRQGLPRALGSDDHFGESVRRAAEQGGADWRVELETQRSAHAELVTVTITVRDGEATRESASDAPKPNRAQATLSQLMALNERDRADARVAEGEVE